MNFYHECQSEAGQGRMLTYTRTDKRMPYTRPLSDHFPDSNAKVKPTGTVPYWQPWHCRHCGHTIFELVET